MPKVKLLRKKESKPTRQATLRSQWQVHIEDHVIALAWSPPDGRWLAAAAVSGPIFLIDTQRGEMIRCLSGHYPGTMALAWQGRTSTAMGCKQWESAGRVGRRGGVGRACDVATRAKKTTPPLTRVSSRSCPAHLG